MPLKTFILTKDKDVTEENLLFFLDFVRDTWDLPLKENNVQMEVAPKSTTANNTPSKCSIM